MNPKITIFIAILLIIFGIFVFVNINNQINQPQQVINNEPIGGDKDDNGCLVGAGYTWCETKQKCLRIWEEGCGLVDTPAAEEDNILTAGDCLSNGGEWGAIGEMDEGFCVLPTSDAYKTCNDKDDCEGYCVATLTEDEESTINEGKSIEKKGQCSLWTSVFGCNALVENGKVNYITCTE